MGVDLEIVSRSLSDNPLKTWEDSEGNLRSTQINEAVQTHVVQELIDQSFVPDAHDLQLEHVRNTAMLDRMDISTWWRKSEAMRKSLAWFEEASQLSTI